jgi:hypothetical protein
MARLTQGQFSLLPDLTDEQIAKQIEYAIKKGDVAIVVDTVPHPSGGEEGYILEIFNDAEESVDTVVVPFSAVELCKDKIAS